MVLSYSLNDILKGKILGLYQINPDSVKREAVSVDAMEIIALQM